MTTEQEILQLLASSEVREALKSIEHTASLIAITICLPSVSYMMSALMGIPLEYFIINRRNRRIEDRLRSLEQIIVDHTKLIND